MSNTHFAKYRGLAVNMTNKLTPTYMERMIVRMPLLKEKNLHPNSKRRWNQMTQSVEPLTWKLHELQKQTLLGDSEFLKQWRPENEPMGTLEALPFSIMRTHTGNLPVYTDIRTGGQRQLTVVRKIEGDIEAFKAELAKVVSNATIEEKMGRLEISGIHSQKVKLWLTRLGF